jgi:hypothetical protein
MAAHLNVTFCDEGDDVSGRGWVVLNPDGTLEGHIYFHLGDDSAFRGERFNRVVRWRPVVPNAACGVAGSGIMVRCPMMSFRNVSASSALADGRRRRSPAPSRCGRRL